MQSGAAAPPWVQMCLDVGRKGSGRCWLLGFQNWIFVITVESRQTSWRKLFFGSWRPAGSGHPKSCLLRELQPLDGSSPTSRCWKGVYVQSLNGFDHTPPWLSIWKMLCGGVGSGGGSSCAAARLAGMRWCGQIYPNDVMLRSSRVRWGQTAAWFSFLVLQLQSEMSAGKEVKLSCFKWTQAVSLIRSLKLYE